MRAALEGSVPRGHEVLLDPARRDLTLIEIRVPQDVMVERRRGGGAFDAQFGERLAHACDGLGACRCMHDELGQQGVVIGDRVAGAAMAVERMPSPWARTRPSPRPGEAESCAAGLRR